jgi:hypothetical protein
MAAVSLNVCDWEGLPKVMDKQRFKAEYRVVRHNLLAIVLSSILLGSLHWADQL